MKNLLDVPSLFTVKHLSSVDSVLSEATRLVVAGVEEDTLVWADEQTNAYGRFQSKWVSPPGNLYCAWIIHPECSLDEALQLGFVTAVSAGITIADVVAPMTDMEYRWPNEILLDGYKVADILIDSIKDEHSEFQWLVVGLSVNIIDHPGNSLGGVISLHEVSDQGELTPQTFLERYCRNLLTWRYRWIHDGFEPVRKSWLNWMVDSNKPLEIKLADTLLKGKFLELRETGDLVLETGDNNSRTVTLREFYGLE